jgi:hypothetical protein
MPIRFFFSLRFLKLFPLAAMLVAVTAAPVAAQSDDEPTEVQKVLGAMGLLDLPKEPIDYSERSPLVVPPSADLPRPGSDENIRALNPDWPVDQDIKRKKAAAKEAKKPIDAPNDLFYGGRLMKPDDWKQAKSKGRGEGAEVMTDEEKRGWYRLSPKELGFKGWDKKDEMVFRHEPERTSLLQPPAGYQTPSPNAPYGIVEEEKVKTTNPFDRGSDEINKR